MTSDGSEVDLEGQLKVGNRYSWGAQHKYDMEQTQRIVRPKVCFTAGILLGRVDFLFLFFLERLALGPVRRGCLRGTLEFYSIRF